MRHGSEVPSRPKPEKENISHKEAEQYVMDLIKRRKLFTRVKTSYEEAHAAAQASEQFSQFSFRHNPLVTEALRLHELQEVVRHLATKAQPDEDWHVPTKRYWRPDEKPASTVLSKTKHVIIGEKHEKTMTRADYTKLIADIESHAVFRRDLSGEPGNTFLDDYPELRKKMPHTEDRAKRIRKEREAKKAAEQPVSLKEEVLTQEPQSPGNHRERSESPVVSPLPNDESEYQESVFNETVPTPAPPQSPPTGLDEFRERAQSETNEPLATLRKSILDIPRSLVEAGDHLSDIKNRYRHAEASEEELIDALHQYLAVLHTERPSEYNKIFSDENVSIWMAREARREFREARGGRLENLPRSTRTRRAKEYLKYKGFKKQNEREKLEAAAYMEKLKKKESRKPSFIRGALTALGLLGLGAGAGMGAYGVAERALQEIARRDTERQPDRPAGSPPHVNFEDLARDALQNGAYREVPPAALQHEGIPHISQLNSSAFSAPGGEEAMIERAEEINEIPEHGFAPADAPLGRGGPEEPNL